MTPTPQQIKAALDALTEFDKIQHEYDQSTPYSGPYKEERDSVGIHTLYTHREVFRALLQQAMDEGMVRVPKVPPHKVISKMGDLAQSITLSKEYPWPRYMMDLYSIALTAADAGEVKP